MHLLCYKEGWRGAPYGSLNRLLNLFIQIGEEADIEALSPIPLQIVRTAISYGLVRFSHYLLYVCHDLLFRQPLDRPLFLADRLMFGNQDSTYMRLVTERSVQMIRSALSEHGVESPPRWNTEFLLRTPSYHEAMLETTQRLIQNSERAINLPLAMELLQFGFDPEPRGVVQALVESGQPMVGVAKAFVVQGLSVPSTLLDPPDRAILASYKRSSKRRGQDSKATSSGQDNLLEDSR
jgi:hypothetical protein